MIFFFKVRYIQFYTILIDHLYDSFWGIWLNESSIFIKTAWQLMCNFFSLFYCTLYKKLLHEQVCIKTIWKYFYSTPILYCPILFPILLSYPLLSYLFPILSYPILFSVLLPILSPTLSSILSYHLSQPILSFLSFFLFHPILSHPFFLPVYSIPSYPTLSFLHPLPSHTILSFLSSFLFYPILSYPYLLPFYSTPS